MDNNNFQSNSNNSQQSLQSYISNENPDVLSNSEIKATVSSGFYPDTNNQFQQTPESLNSNNANYSSTNTNSFSNQPTYGQEILPQPQSFENQVGISQNPINLSQIQNNSQSLNPPSIQPQIPLQPVQNYQPSQSTNFGNQLAQAANSQSANVNPLQPKTNIIYKTVQKGDGFIINLLKKLFNCSGCFLFLITIIIGVFIYFISI